MLQQIHDLRLTNLQLESDLQAQTDHSSALAARLRTVKEKYSYLKKQRNEAYAKVRELSSEAKSLDKKLFSVTNQLSELKLMQSQEIL